MSSNNPDDQRAKTIPSSNQGLKSGVRETLLDSLRSSLSDRLGQHKQNSTLTQSTTCRETKPDEILKLSLSAGGYRRQINT